jgi:alanine-synthesizing transaminase
MTHDFTHPVRAHLADVRYEIRGALTRRARDLEAAGLDIIKLNIGNPGRYGFEAPAHLREAIANHLHDSEAYGHEQGLEIARDTIAAQQRARGARHVDAERIFIGNGVSELIDLSLRALLQSGDEVLLPSPDYPLWSAATILNGGRPRYYRCLAANGHLPDPDEIEALITPRTRALVLINPNNPTGAVYPRALLERLVAVAARHRLLLLSDEIYDEILYDDAVFQPLAEVAGELPCISFGGLSKVHRACGYRVGWMSLSGDPARTSAYRDALQLLAALRLCANVTAQWAVIPALQDAPTIGTLTVPGGRLYEARQAVIARRRRQRLSGSGDTRRCAVCVPASSRQPYRQLRRQRFRAAPAGGGVGIGGPRLQLQRGRKPAYPAHPAAATGAAARSVRAHRTGAGSDGGSAAASHCRCSRLNVPMDAAAESDVLKHPRRALLS